MDRVNRFFELKELWKQSAEADRPAIDRQITELMNGMADQEIEELRLVYKRILTYSSGTCRYQGTAYDSGAFGTILPYLSVSKLSKDYFNKSSSWFYQRLNGNKIHGKVCRFTDKELETLDRLLKILASVFLHCG